MLHKIEKLRKKAELLKAHPVARMMKGVDDLILDVVGLLNEMAERIETMEGQVYSLDNLKLPKD